MVDAGPKRVRSHGKLAPSVPLLDDFNLGDQGEHIRWLRRDPDY
jgi:hypothetical protein